MSDRQYLQTHFHQTKHFYVCTISKVASSWLYDFLSSHSDLMDTKPNGDFYSSTLEFSQTSLDVRGTDENISYDFQIVSTDWYNLLNGGEVSRDFIFFVRNPVNRFVSILIKDILFDNVNTNSEEFLEQFKEYSNKDELERFLNLNLELSADNYYWLLENGESWKNELIKKIVGYWIGKKVSSFFKTETGANYISELKISNIYLIHKLLLNSSADKSKLKIVDIEKENLKEYFDTNYGLNISKRFNDKINIVPTPFKELVILYLKKYSHLVEGLLRENILMYIDIHEKLYGQRLSYEQIFDQL